MNTFNGSGRLVRNAIVHGTDKKVLKFTIAAKYGYDKEAQKERVEFLPCVIFSPSEPLEEHLVKEGKGTFVEFQGRVASSKFEVNGDTKYATEVVVNTASFNIVTR